jgi:hypothetical protein
VLAVRRHRRQPAAVLLQGDVAKNRELRGDAFGQPPQHRQIERHVVDAESRWQSGHVVSARLASAAPGRSM